MRQDVFLSNASCCLSATAEFLDSFLYYTLVDNFVVLPLYMHSLILYADCHWSSRCGCDKVSNCHIRVFVSNGI